MERWLKRQRWQTILTAENGSRSLAMFAQYLGCGRRHGWGCGDPLLLLLLLHCCNCAIEVAGCCWLVASRLVSVVWAVKEVCPSVVCRRFLLFPFCRLQSAVSSLDTSQSRTQLKTQTKYNKKKIIIKTRKKGGTKQGEPQSSGAFPQKGIGHQRPGKPRVWETQTERAWQPEPEQEPGTTDQVQVDATARSVAMYPYSYRWERTQTQTSQSTFTSTTTAMLSVCRLESYGTKLSLSLAVAMLCRRVYSLQRECSIH